MLEEIESLQNNTTAINNIVRDINLEESRAKNKMLIEKSRSFPITIVSMASTEKQIRENHAIELIIANALEKYLLSVEIIKNENRCLQNTVDKAEKTVDTLKYNYDNTISTMRNRIMTEKDCVIGLKQK